MILQPLKSIQTSADLIKEHAEAKAFSGLRAEISALYKSLLDAQSQAVELHNELRLMKEEYMKTKDWEDKTVPNYTLSELAPGIFVYSFNPAEQSKEPPHNLCADCFLKQRKSILQRTRRDGLGIHYHCANCGADILDHTKAENYRPPASVKIRKSERSRF